MKSLWSDEESKRFEGPLGPRVYTSRLLGRDKSLVLHGGGNTSVKMQLRNVFGDEVDALFVKGSGWDLDSIEAPGFTPVALAPVRRLADLPALSDPQMVSELNVHSLRAGAPSPSVETILHAVLPHTYVDHTHADAVLSVSNSPRGTERIRDLYGERAIVVPYVMAGFDLARQCAKSLRESSVPNAIGIILLSHGVISFGADARESYERMIDLVSMAERYLDSRKTWHYVLRAPPPEPINRVEVATLRQAISLHAGGPMLLRLNRTPKFLGFARHPEVDRLARQGPATPDHVIRTKPTPLIGRDVDEYARHYDAYFHRHAARAKESKSRLDAAPRMVLDMALGFGAVGRSARETRIIEELYDHTIDVILRAEGLGGWHAVPEEDIFDIEYWDLEQAKLRRSSLRPAFAGEVALVTGAASGIGRACVDALLARGAAVLALDRDPALDTLWARDDVVAVVGDVTQASTIEAALDRCVERFGGLDMLILNAGIFPATRSIASMTDQDWRTAMSVNLDANLMLMQSSHPLLCLAPGRGRVVVIGSKNVPAPGPGAAAYSASKAALNQLVRVAALEWGADGIRINTLHPNAVYDTALWSDRILKDRADAYGLSVAEYQRNNILRTEVRATDVAALAAELCGPLFSKTTAAQIPVDGGNERVI